MSSHYRSPPERDAHLDLRAVPASAALARAFTSATLRGWHAEACIDTATLLVSELVTNAVLHARSDLQVTLHRGERSVRIAVHDAARSRPEPRTPGDQSLTGRGLQLVTSLADEWGVEDSATGKQVWFRLQLA